MKRSLILICWPFLFSNCAFKKDSNPDASTLRAERQQSLQNAITFNSQENLKTFLKDYSAEDLNAYQPPALEIALKRGSPEIVQELLSRGASPFAQSGDLKVYEKLSSYSPMAADVVGNRLRQYIMQLGLTQNSESAFNELLALGANCADAMNIYAWESSVQNISPKLNPLQVFDTPFCLKNLDLRNHQSWVQGEIITLIKHPERSLFYLEFLQKLKGFQDFKLKLSNRTETYILSVPTLIKALKSIEPYKDSISDKRTNELTNEFPPTEFEFIEVIDSRINSLNKMHVSLNSETVEILKSTLSRDIMATSEKCLSSCILEISN
ncbi:hypothetical protein [Bdellovibrio bacteriovorus]|uniref:hypothetical protein n=1 Tax=Bdellovibrio bacteriovorus TaxID=959 RepID=UPI0035A73377